MQGRPLAETRIECRIGAALVRLCLLLWTGLASASVTGLAASSSLPLDIASARHLNLSASIEVCVAPPQASLEQVLAGACERDSRRPPPVSRSFDRRAFWLRLDLVNSSAARVERLLSVGHARLQSVSLFLLPPTGSPLALGVSGSRTPLIAKPVPLPKPTFKLEFAPGERKTLWLRVASETIIEFALELQSPETGYFQAQRLQLFQALAIGCILLCVVYSLGTYLILRESTLLYFGIFMTAEIMIELTRSGLLQTYLWPASLPFDSRMLPLGSAVSIGAFSLFLRGFIPEFGRYPFSHRVFIGAMVLFYAGVLACVLVDYRVGSIVWGYALIVWILSILNLTLRSWRHGSPTAKILLHSFMLLMVIELLRVWSLAGWLDFSEIETVGNPWAIALSSAVILISMIRRLREMQSDLFKTRAESAARLSFMSQMSHELRSPLSTILGHLRLLTGAGLPQRAKPAVEAMRQDARQLLSLIDDILDYAQGTAGKQRLHPGVRSWSRLTQRIEQRARILAQTNGNRLVFHADGTAQAMFSVDERRLLQVLSNLLSNAANYCRNGVIELDCRIEQDPPSGDWHLHFIVSDTGPGIDLADQQRIFQPFERGAGAHLSHHKGVGMGLAISRQLVERMGGRISLWSEPGQGSRFSVEIPCLAAQPEEEGDEADAQEELQPDISGEVGVAMPGQAPVAVDLSLMTRPDVARLFRLQQLADNGQITDILDLLDALEQDNPELGIFCRTARDLALQLDLAALRQMSCSSS
jgi:signal transduction histidine kinase